MPMATKELQREYGRKWVAQRRADFFADKKCEWCGSTDELQLHHRDPETKIASVIWSWSEKRRLEEIEKCIVLCGPCHRKHHAKLKTESAWRTHGHASYYRWYGCRCDLCKKAACDDVRNRRLRKKLEAQKPDAR